MMEKQVRHERPSGPVRPDPQDGRRFGHAEHAARRANIDPSQVDEKGFAQIEAIIYSMTKEEREKPSIINPKRKRRIAAGSGTRVEDVNRLLRQYEMMQKMMKQMRKSPKGFARRLSGDAGRPALKHIRYKSGCRKGGMALTYKTKRPQAGRTNQLSGGKQLWQ